MISLTWIRAFQTLEKRGRVKGREKRTELERERERERNTNPDQVIRWRVEIPGKFANLKASKAKNSLKIARTIQQRYEVEAGVPLGPRLLYCLFLPRGIIVKSYPFLPYQIVEYYNFNYFSTIYYINQIQ